MSKKDETNATIDIIKSIILSLIVAFFTMLGYGFINKDKLSNTDKAILIIAIIVVAASLSSAGNFIYKKIKELKDL